jgi:hypothetical protein
MNTILLLATLWGSPPMAIIGATITHLRLKMMLALHVTCCVHLNIRSMWNLMHFEV